MSRAEHYRALWSLLTHPERAGIATLDDGRRVVTDQITLIDIPACNLDPAIAGLADGMYRVRKSGPPTADAEHRYVDPARMGANLTRLVALWEAASWSTLTPTHWCTLTHSGKGADRMLRHARMLICEDGPVWVQSERLDAWETFAAPRSLYVSHTPAPIEPGKTPPLRIEAVNSYHDARDGLVTYRRALGFVMPVRVEVPAFPNNVGVPIVPMASAYAGDIESEGGQ